MNKAELVDEVSSRTGATKSQTNDMVSEVFDVILDALKSGDGVRLPFGTFSVKRRPARKMRSIQNRNEMIEVKASNVVKFSPSAASKRAVN